MKTPENMNAKEIALRFNAGKTELSYMLEMPNAMREFADRCAFGAKKYDRLNWKKGLYHYELVDAALRHLTEFMNGDYIDNDDLRFMIENDIDPDDYKLTHLSGALWNIAALIEMQYLHPEMKNRECKEETHNASESVGSDTLSWVLQKTEDSEKVWFGFYDGKVVASINLLTSIATSGGERSFYGTRLEFENGQVDFFKDDIVLENLKIAVSIVYQINKDALKAEDIGDFTEGFVTDCKNNFVRNKETDIPQFVIEKDRNLYLIKPLNDDFHLHIKGRLSAFLTYARATSVAYQWLYQHYQEKK